MSGIFRLCYCLTIVVYLAVSLHRFDTIVKNDMCSKSPEITIVLYMWHKPKMEPFCINIWVC